MRKIIGRTHEQKIFSQLFESNESEFIAVHGRRRVGKTYLISEFFKNKGTYFELTGQLKINISEQLDNFSLSIKETFALPLEIKKPGSWKEAFGQLKIIIDQQDKKQKIIIFFDEVPWLASKRSGFISALEYFWNTWASRKNNIKIIVCGSAASWMIRNFVNSKGGLHNRLTASIRLMPFDLSETKEYLEYRGIHFSDRQVLDIYMIMGGIPHYLKKIRKGLSAVQNINEVCFKKDGFLTTEFDRLYDSLFDNSSSYKTIITALTKSRKGMLRSELRKTINATPGGTLARMLSNLEEAGFITGRQQFNKKIKEMRYHLCDEYSYFYIKWIKNIDRSVLINPKSNYWNLISETQAWKIWSGYIFEEICIKHSHLIKKALGISGVITRSSAWNYSTAKKAASTKGAQIDLLFDRNDRVISICEIKCHNSPFQIDKKYSEVLKNKISVFREQTKTNKSIFLVFVTTMGMKKNDYYDELVDNEVTLKDLFAEGLAGLDDDL
ncbi:MAG: AAA family ATPase [bacterium]|nr:AAA family ATPase [bacterium]